MKKTKKNRTPDSPSKPSHTNPIYSQWHWAFPIAGLMFIGFIYAEFYKPALENKWVTGSNLVQASRDEKDPTLKNKMLEEGGAILREQVKLHPYHARVLQHYAYYFLEKSLWDSSLYYERKAILTGTGGIINRVRTEGKSVINFALSNSLDQHFNNPDLCLELINGAAIPGFENDELDKFRGIIQMNAARYDSALAAFTRYKNKNPKDFQTLLYIAKNYFSLKQVDSAQKYAGLAKIEQPNDPGLLAFLAQLNR